MMWERAERSMKTSNNPRIGDYIKKERWHRKTEASWVNSYIDRIFAPKSFSGFNLK